jgi:hypothetical protein
MAELHTWLADAEIDLRVGGRVVLRWLNTDAAGNHAVMTATITKFFSRIGSHKTKAVDWPIDRWRVQYERYSSRAI